jgi:hypothetical protein
MLGYASVGIYEFVVSVGEQRLFRDPRRREHGQVWSPS